MMGGSRRQSLRRRAATKRYNDGSSCSADKNKDNDGHDDEDNIKNNNNSSTDKSNRKKRRIGDKRKVKKEEESYSDAATETTSIKMQKDETSDEDEESKRKRRSLARKRNFKETDSGNTESVIDGIKKQLDDESFNYDDDNNSNNIDSEIVQNGNNDNNNNKRAKVETRTDGEEHNNKNNENKDESSNKSIKQTKKEEMVEEINTTKECNNNKKRRKVEKKCPYCNKNFSVATGLNYHINNYVCRLEQKPPTPPITEKKEYKKIRGKLEKRKCPNCSRVFTSPVGLQYHLDKKVCENPDRKTIVAADGKAFHILRPGQCFATKYGIVQVIIDNRATPIASLPNDISKKVKTYQSAVYKRESQIRKLQTDVAVSSRARRALLARAYEKNEINSFSPYIHEAYWPKEIDRVISRTHVRQPPEDPNVPPGSYPDRIVECIALPDTRTRLVMDDNNNTESELDGKSSIPLQGVRMYIPRRLLTTVYSAETTKVYCSRCWQCFLSKPGCKHHINTNACVKKLEKDKKNDIIHLYEIDRRSKQVLTRFDHEKKLGMVNPVPIHRPVKEELQPPIVVQSKNFRTSTGKFAGPMLAGAKTIPGKNKVEIRKAMAKRKVEKATEKVAASEAVENPLDVLRELETEFYKIQNIMLGPMYPSVWKALGYEKPRPPQKPKKKKKKKIVSRKRKRKKKVDKTEDDKSSKKDEKEGSKAAAAAPPPSPPPQPNEAETPQAFEPPLIVDTRALVSEVEAGRYPSIKHYSGDHEEICAICKDFECPLPDCMDDTTLHNCGYCKQVVHFDCMKTRFLVKEPEPEDDFMCHNCIGVIIARRNRAEKRRLEKLNPDEEAPTNINPEDIKNDDIELMYGPIPDREFECVAAQCRRIDECTELLRDAQKRLSLKMHAASINQTRRMLLCGYEKRTTLHG